MDYTYEKRQFAYVDWVSKVHVFDNGQLHLGINNYPILMEIMDHQNATWNLFMDFSFRLGGSLLP
jgi:hypothetical protein